MNAEQQQLLRECRDYAKSSPDATHLMEQISHLLHERVARYNWVGFYLVAPDDPNVLIVGPYVGSFAPNIRIPLDTGLCGAAARTAQTVVVNHVTKDPRYLAGSSMVISEVVVPIFVNQELAAELDIESYFPGTFTKAELEFVEGCAEIVADCLRKPAAAHSSARV